ncbi:MAG: Sec-independent protein translocase protein TatB [Mixta sp.]
MFDIGFSELVLVFVIGLVVLGPQRLPIAVKTVVGWIRAMRSLAANVQNELAQELKLQELQESLKKVEQASKDSLTPELKESMEELRKSAESMRRSYLGENEQADDEAHTIHNPLIKDPHDEHTGATPASADHQASAPAQKPQADNAVQQPVVNNAAAPSKSVADDLPAVSPSQPTMNDKHGR